MHEISAGTPRLDGYMDSAHRIDSLASGISFTTEAINCSAMAGYSVTVSCPATGSPVGTFKLQGCNDIETFKDNRTADSNLVNWFDVATAGDRITSVAVSGATCTELRDPHCRYRWFRVAWVASSGTIHATIKFEGKG